MLNFLKSKPNHCLGIDIGTDLLKIVELRKNKERLILENYGIAKPDLSQINYNSSFRTSNLSVSELAGLIKNILFEAKIKTKKAVISLPIFSSFSVLITLPDLPDKELVASIPFEVKKYIPVSMEEVVLDWSIVKKLENVQTVTSDLKKTAVKKNEILVIAVPREIINKYVQVVKLVGLELLSLEHESFSLARVLIGNDPETYLIVDIGSHGSSVIVVDGGFVVLNHILEKNNSDSVCDEIKRVVGIYKMKYNKNIKTCFMVGNVEDSKIESFLPSCLVGVETVIGNSFARIEYPEALEVNIKKVEPLLAVATGLAMRELN